MVAYSASVIRPAFHSLYALMVALLSIQLIGKGLSLSLILPLASEYGGVVGKNLVDFPKGFDTDSLRRLFSCGI